MGILEAGEAEGTQSIIMALFIPHRCPKCFESVMLKASPQVIWKSKVHW